MELEGKVNVGSGKLFAEGGICGCDNGWRGGAQMGAAGGFGYLATKAKQSIGSARKLHITDV